MAVLHGSSWQIIAGIFAVTTGVTFGYASLPALLVEQVTPAETGIANSVNSTAHTVGSSLASAFFQRDYRLVPATTRASSPQ
jgi:uncharacterized membrane protein YfcA